MDADFMRALRGTLMDRSESLGWLLDQSSLELEDMLMRLSVLLGAGVVGASVSSGADAEALSRTIAAFNQRCLDQITAGEEIGALLSPVLLQPVTVSLLEAFCLQAANADLPAEDVVQLVWMGITMAGGSVKDPEGRPIEDPNQALGHLQEFWETFGRERLPVLRRLGIGLATA